MTPSQWWSVQALKVGAQKRSSVQPANNGIAAQAEGLLSRGRGNNGVRVVCELRQVSERISAPIHGAVWLERAFGPSHPDTMMSGT